MRGAIHADARSQLKRVDVRRAEYVLIQHMRLHKVGEGLDVVALVYQGHALELRQQRVSTRHAAGGPPPTRRPVDDDGACPKCASLSAAARRGR